MSLFAPGQNSSGDAPDRSRRDTPQYRDSPRRSRLGTGILTVGIVGALGLALIPAPYVIERPGPVFDTLGSVTIKGQKVSVISIADETTFPTDGTLDMLTVNIVGNREDRPTWFSVIQAWADPSRAVIPLDAVYPEGESIEQSNAQSSLDMENSQQEAVAAALTELGYDVGATLSVVAVAPDSPADGSLEKGDQVVSINGTSPASVSALRSLVADNGTDAAASVAIVRDGSPLTFDITPEVGDSSGQPVLGIGVGADFDFPFDVKIQLDNVGGPSAGMMFALGIIDKLTPGALNGGESIAGTGTISSDGTVGGIGGIRQKMFGAKDAGARYFLAPSENCDEVVGHVPAGLTVFAVATLDDSLAALDAIAAKKSTSALPTCAAK